jgi:hypothetical protein
MMKWTVLNVLYANMRSQQMMITQKCDQSIVQNAERNLFIKIQENNDLLGKEIL